MTRLQIGVIGSAADLKYKKEIEIIAEEIGANIAKNNCILVYGAEKDCDSLSTVACRGAKKYNGLTVGITYNKGKDIFNKDTDVIISTGMDRGGGREFVLSLSCDVLIAINGGSGTLNEIVIAYQANIPIIVLENTGGWSEKLSNIYIDDRKKVICKGVKTAKEAVDYAISLFNK
jgi:uncharacterized protein (TIGR00725 family)